MPLCCHSAALQGHTCAHYPAVLLPPMTSMSPRSMTFKDDEFTPACVKDHLPWAIRQAASLLGNLNFTKNLPSLVGPGPPGWDSTALPGRTVLKSLQWKIEPVSGCLLEISTSRPEESNGSQFSWKFSHCQQRSSPQTICKVPSNTPGGWMLAIPPETMLCPFPITQVWRTDCQGNFRAKFSVQSSKKVPESCWW